MPGAALRADGPRLCRDIGVALPAIDGVSIHLDSLISLPGSWQLYLRARPRWPNHSRAGQRENEPVSVHAEDDYGGSYLGSYARNTGLRSEEKRPEERVMDRERALQFAGTAGPGRCAFPGRTPGDNGHC